MSKKKNIWKILGMAGMIFGFLGTMMQGYAEDKDLDVRNHAYHKDFEVVKALQNYADVYREREEEDYGD